MRVYVGPFRRIVVRNTLIRSVAPFAARWHRERPRLRVIVFHDIPQGWEDRFRSKLRWLISKCHIVSLEDLFHRTGLDERRLNVALTFDDGYKDCISVAAPALKEHSIPATFFIPSGVVGATGVVAHDFARLRLGRQGNFEFLGAEDVRQLAADSLFEIGGHATHHADLGGAHSAECLEEEIARDKWCLEDLVQRQLRWFAFPFGQYQNVSRRALGVIREAGYLASFTIVPSFWTAHQSPYLVGRDSLSVWHSDALWRAWLRGGYDGISRLKSWRALRALYLLPERP